MSNDLAAEACKEAALALLALEVDTTGWDDEMKDELKAAKRACRNVLIWRCHGSTLGIDSHNISREMFGRYGQLVNPKNDVTYSQLTNGWKRMLALITGHDTFDAEVHYTDQMGPSLLAPLGDPAFMSANTPRRRSTSPCVPVKPPNLDGESDLKEIAKVVRQVLRERKKNKQNERPQAAPRTPRNQAGNQACNHATAQGSMDKPKGQQGRGFALFQVQQQLPAPAEWRWFQHAAH